MISAIQYEENTSTIGFILDDCTYQLSCINKKLVQITQNSNNIGKIYNFIKKVNFKYEYQNECLIIKIDNKDFAILETDKSVINDEPFHIYDMDVELTNIKHLLNANDFDELDDLWDN